METKASSRVNSPSNFLGETRQSENAKQPELRLILVYYNLFCQNDDTESYHRQTNDSKDSSKDSQGTGVSAGVRGKVSSPSSKESTQKPLTLPLFIPLVSKNERPCHFQFFVETLVYLLAERGGERYTNAIIWQQNE